MREKLEDLIENYKDLDVVKSEKYTLGKQMDVWFEKYVTTAAQVNAANIMGSVVGVG